MTKPKKRKRFVRKLIIQRWDDDLYAHFETSPWHHANAEDDRTNGEAKSHRIDSVHLDYECNLDLTGRPGNWHMVIDAPKGK